MCVYVFQLRWHYVKTYKSSHASADNYDHQGPFLLTQINLNYGMDK